MKFVKTLAKIVFGGLISYVCLNLIIIFIFTHPTPSVVRPDEGIWYCEELKIQLSFEDDSSYTVVNGRSISCTWGNDRGSDVIMVLCQEPNIEEYRLGDTVFWGHYVHLTDDEYIVSDGTTSVEYTFERIDPIP